ncbi:unnamed protein product [Phytophthora fragariaefolia]|uniref:Unnamed protein product n=1 Tax=Phytophthora fragariaefolia TaxID=1490495 RepID=A0A9W6WVA6_9STRA|nr:unnamed protein product [Phytophthora fragariaefolia]
MVYCIIRGSGGDVALRLVVPTTMIDEVLHSCHNSIEGGHQGIVRTFHQVKADFYWVGLYADVSKHVQACEDCSTSKRKPQLRGYSPGNVTSEYPFQMVSMDFVASNSARQHSALAVPRPFYWSKSRVTLSYRPPANGQQERSVKPMIQTVRAYVEDPLQADWDDIAEKMMHAINNSRDMTRRETPFYLVHGWDAPSTLKSMTFMIKKDPASSAGAAQWRQLRRKVWLIIKRVRPGLRKKLAHRWRGPFRVKKKMEAFAYALELSDKSGYRFYPVVHVSRLKKVADLGQRPTAKLVDELSENDRFDFDEELLPEDSWELSDTSDKYEVEVILDDKIPNSTNTSRAQRLFKVKWVGYDGPTWEHLSKLSCGGLLFDCLRSKKRERRMQMVQVADEN